MLSSSDIGWNLKVHKNEETLPSMHCYLSLETLLNHMLWDMEHRRHHRCPAKRRTRGESVMERIQDGDGIYTHLSHQLISLGGKRPCLSFSRILISKSVCKFSLSATPSHIIANWHKQRVLTTSGSHLEGELSWSPICITGMLFYVRLYVIYLLGVGFQGLIKTR